VTSSIHACNHLESAHGLDTATSPADRAGCSDAPTVNRCQVIRTDGREESATMTTGLALERGDLIRITMGCGGGYGNPRERDRAHVAADLHNGFIDPDYASEVYGVSP
jgi:N-methylhydantoinase B/oxoprolinase/acetone carboxylase alpha subunit